MFLAPAGCRYRRDQNELDYASRLESVDAFREQLECRSQPKRRPDTERRG
jgi:hypothetical protein